LSINGFENGSLDSYSLALSDRGKSDASCSPYGLAWAIKDLLERGIALCLIVLFVPFLIFISLLIVLETAGPAIFVQPRFGKDGKPFGILKFRTMRSELCDESGAAQTADEDPRITKIGLFLRRTSLDEIPQLFNVLFGQMAIIGPRAHPCGMCVEKVECTLILPIYHNRHIVKPGITGWAQINGSRGAVKTLDMLSRRVKLDMDYINNWSLWLDVKIMFRTISVVFGGKLAT